jgi:hypothetical protein
MKQFRSYYIAGLAIIGISFISDLNSPVDAISQVSRSHSELSSNDNFLVASLLRFRFNVRPSRYRIGGFQRGGCSTLITLSPPINSDTTNCHRSLGVDTTVSDHPTFFVYVPQLKSTTAQFTLEDETGTQELYSTNFALSGEPGIIGIRIPDTIPPLEVGQNYHWIISVAEDPTQPDNSLFTEGWVKRVAPDAALVGVDRLSPRDRVNHYAEAGIWQETLSTLAELRYQHPTDQSLAADWENLMKSANLPQFVTTPIIQIQ